MRLIKSHGRKYARRTGNAAAIRRIMRHSKMPLQLTPGRPVAIKVKQYTDLLTTSNTGEVKGTYQSIPTSAADWSHYSGLFDQCRIKGMTVKFFPSGTEAMSNTSTALGGTAGVQGQSYVPCYVFFESDSPTFPSAVTSANAALGYDNCKVFNLFRPFKYKHKVDHLTSNYASVGSYRIFANGWQDLQDMTAAQSINIYVPTSNYALQEVSGIRIGTVIVEFNLEFKNRN